MAPRSSHASDAEDALPSIHASGQKDDNQASKVTEEVRTLTLGRKVALCAGLMGSEAIGVFDNLNTMPLLQALGAPTYILTLPGVISAIVAVGSLPLLGCLADGGTNPRKRKKPVTIAAYCIGLLGVCFNLTSVLLSGWRPESPSNNTISSSVTDDSMMDATSLESTNQSLPNGQDILALFTNITNYQMELSDESNVSLLSEEMGSSPNLMDSGTSELPVCVGLTLAGMIFIDLGFDLISSAVKALMLTHSAPADHMSLLMVAVIMAALGGCTTSVSGLVDFGGLIHYLDPVFSQAAVQLVFLFILGILCCCCSVLSAHSPLSPKDLSHSQFPTDPCPDEEDKQGEADYVEDRDESTVTPWSEATENVFFAVLTPAEALMSNSVQLERSFKHLSMSASFSQSNLSRSLRLHRPDNEKTGLLLTDDLHYQSIPEHTETSTAADNGRVASKPKLKMLVVWLAAFFSASGVFTFNLIISDYMGKVIYGGNPYAEAGSEDYTLYHQGTHMAALCILILNVTYVIAALCQNKVLAVISPKAEYALVNLCFLLLLMAVQQSGNLYVFVACCALAGMNRTALYTVPFLLATQLCQQSQAKTFSPEEGRREGSGGSSGFGIAIGLVTSALPSGYLLTSSITGPLIDATGDPSSPLMLAMVCLLMSVFTICCYK